MRGGEDDVVPVELIDVDEPAALHEPGRTPGAERSGEGEADRAPGASRRRSRWAVPVAVAVLAGIAAVVLGASALDQRRERARWDTLEALGWPLVDLSEPLVEAWRAPGGHPLVEGDGLLVLQGVGSIPDYRGVDLATGAVRWEVPGLSGEWCQASNPAWPSPAADGRWPTAPDPSTPPPSLLVCGSGGVADGTSVRAGEMSRLRVIDLASGAKTVSVGFSGRLLDMRAVAGGVITSHQMATGEVVLTRRGLPGGEVAWSRTVAPPPSDVGDPWSWLMVADGVVQLSLPDGTVLAAFDERTGEEAAPTDGPVLEDFALQALPDGAEVRLTYGFEGTGGTVVGPDGAERFAFDGELWTPTATDGSMADRIVISTVDQEGVHLVALDVTSGAEIWRVPAPAAYVAGGGVLQMDGLLVGGSPLVSVTDLRTGERRWEVMTDAPVGMPFATDGTRLALPLQVEGRPYLAALDLRSGAERWRIPAEPGLWYWETLGDGTVLGIGTDGIFAYR